MQLIAFPYSGGNASCYGDWRGRLCAEVELVGVQLPGRASRFVKKGSGDEIRSTNPALLASSRAGRVARQLYDGVLAIQGPLGNLSRLQMQRHPEMIASDAPETTAYWSPDGEMGRTASGT